MYEIGKEYDLGVGVTVSFSDGLLKLVSPYYDENNEEKEDVILLSPSEIAELLTFLDSIKERIKEAKNGTAR